ncbi:MAG: glutaminyl-peptide cyclotransferase [Acetobacteraceae bacterium]
MTQLLAILAILCFAFNALALELPGPEARPHGHTQLTRDRVLKQNAIPVYGYRIVATYSHDTTAYTEGLVMVGGAMYEGTGLYGHSLVRRWDLKTGQVLQETKLPDIYFGEGVTVLDNTVFELTYLENTAFTYNPVTLQRQGEYRYVNQGWGLTHDGAHLIMSDGSSAIQFLNPKTHELVRRVFVTDSIGPVGFLNELEYDRGKLYANVWQTDFIAIIDPESGRITGWIDLTGLNPDPQKLVYPLVLNGIAVNTETGRLLVTGKCWPHVWEIELVAPVK